MCPRGRRSCSRWAPSARLRCHVNCVEALLHLPFVKRLAEFWLRPLVEPAGAALAAEAAQASYVSCHITSCYAELGEAEKARVAEINARSAATKEALAAKNAAAAAAKKAAAGAK